MSHSLANEHLEQNKQIGIANINGDSIDYGYVYQCNNPAKNTEGNI